MVLGSLFGKLEDTWWTCETSGVVVSPKTVLPKIIFLQLKNNILLYLSEFLSKYEVKTIPTFRIIKPDGTVVIEDARTEVQVKK